MGPPITMAKGWWNEVDGEVRYPLYPATVIVQDGRAGAAAALHPEWLAPSAVRRVKGSKRHLRQHKICDASNAGTGFSSRMGRVADTPC